MTTKAIWKEWNRYQECHQKKVAKFSICFQDYNLATRKMVPEVKQLEQEAHDVFINKVEPILNEKLEEFEKYFIPIVEKMIDDNEIAC
jgi:hypothetical protein